MKRSDIEKPAAATTGFEAFCRAVEPRLRRALVARFGEQQGREATLDALAYAWSNWDRLEAMDNAAGYLYRRACRATVRLRHRESRRAGPTRSSDFEGETGGPGDYEPRLGQALASLSTKQRTAVLLVHGWHYSQTEAAEVLEMSISTLRTHLDRGMARLRKALEVSDVKDS
jgi:DNA-directed RNA polymerase specialized sigma24 family protein